MGKDFPTVLFSVETAARELDSKLVMAAALAGRGCRVVVGHKEEVSEVASRSTRVLWQGKSLFSVQSNDHLADRLAAQKSSIMFMSDEGAMHQADSWDQQTLHKHWVDHFEKRRIDCMCVWGERQRDVIANHSPRLGSCVSVTGSARFDLCLPRFASITEEISGQFPDRPYILVCTRFSALAHHNGLSAPFKIKLNRNAWPERFSMGEITDLWFRKWRRDAHDFAEFAVLIRELATAQPDRAVVVRPHPSESLDFYRLAFAAQENVHVIREGNVLKWIRAADLVVHSGSTSGVEAALAGRPVVNFLPATGGRADETDIEVAREAGAVVGSVNEALECIDQLLAGPVPAVSWSAKAKSTLNNLRTDAIPLLVEATILVLRNARIDASSVVLPRAAGWAVRMRRWRRPDRAQIYGASKRGRLSSSYVERILERCTALNVGNGRLRHFNERYVVIDPG